MAALTAGFGSIKNVWEVFLLFLIPIGGGIPGGVVLARSRNITWPVMLLLYFLSDLVLACVFEPLMLAVIAAGAKSPRWARFHEAFRQSMAKTILQYGSNLGPLALILIAFGVDPMTGRAVAKSSGHGFVTGWMLAITGDMFYFTMLMVSTIWLNNALGDGFWTTLVMTLLMFVVPGLLRQARQAWRFRRNKSQSRRS
ncbi:MAG: hypothetical protein HY074_20735 [Deltaproteobacteria bacterium]|nr:hypothetical protein [Deltaproteobacteria bacterium]